MISRKLMYQIHKCLTKYLVFPRTAFLVENQYFSVETFISCHRFKLSPSLGVMKHVHLKQLLVQIIDLISSQQNWIKSNVKKVMHCLWISSIKSEWVILIRTQSTITYSNLTIETLEQGAKYVQVNNKDTRTTPLVSFWCLYC